MKKILIVVALLGAYGVNAQSFTDQTKKLETEAKKQYKENKTEIDDAAKKVGVN